MPPRQYTQKFCSEIYEQPKTKQDVCDVDNTKWRKPWNPLTTISIDYEVTKKSLTAAIKNRTGNHKELIKYTNVGMKNRQTHMKN